MTVNKLRKTMRKEDDGSDSDTDKVVEGEALQNTVATTLSIFPLVSRSDYQISRKRRRSHFSSEDTEPLYENTGGLLEDVLFPSELSMLDNSLDRVQLDRPTKKRKSSNALSNMLNRLQKNCTENPLTIFKAGKNGVRRNRRNQKGYAPLKIPAEVSRVVSVTKPELKVYLPPNEFGVKTVNPYKLFPYQKDSVQWMLDMERGVITNLNFDDNIRGGVLAMVMGLGKTFISSMLVMATLDKQRREKSCTLYICPKNLLGTVRYEFDKFFGDQLRVLVYHRDFLRSDYAKFNSDDIRKYDVIITNYSSVTHRINASGLLPKERKKKLKNSSPCETKDENMEPSEKTSVAASFANFPWYRILLDESHEIRTESTRRFQCMKYLRSPRRFCLTGTPIHNSLKDLFVQLKFCGLLHTKGIKFNRDTLKAMKLLEMVKFVEYKDAKAVNLPEKTIHMEYFSLSDEERFLHEHFLKRTRKIYRDIENAATKEKGKKTIEAHTGLLRIMQICTAPYLITSLSKKDSTPEDMAKVSDTECVFPSNEGVNSWIQKGDGGAGTTSSKMTTFVNTVTDLHEEDVTRKIVVFANYTSSLRLAIGALNQKTPSYTDKSVFVHGKITSEKNREKLFGAFRTDPKVTILFMTLKIGSVGLNLTEATSVIFLEPWHSYAAMSQGMGRVHRIGQVHPVDIYFLLAANSVEERVYRSALEKRKIDTDVRSDKESGLGKRDMETILFDDIE
jgi:SNF2 family DNA or RNA helicase